MYIIPTIEKRIDYQKPTALEANPVSQLIRLNPSIYTVPTYPLNILYGYKVEIFSPFVIAPSNWVLLSVENVTEEGFLASVPSLSTLAVNTYYKKLNTLYPLLNATGDTIEIKFVIFTNLVGLITDISLYTDQGCILEEVNITGHIANFSSMDREFVLEDIIATKTNFPIPAALRFKKEIDLSSSEPFTVYNLNSNIGQVDYVLYNNILYNRSRTPVPSKQTFTTRSGGGLLWI